MGTLLVAYASRHGSTREVAEAVAARLRERGHEVVIRPAADVGELEPYGGVVLGGALYFGRLHRDAVAFLARYESELAERPLAVFALGPKTAEPKDLAACRAQLDRALRKAPEPRAIAVFGGAIRPDELRFPFSRLPASDARDWDAIEAWADEVGEALQPAENPQ